MENQSKSGTVPTASSFPEHSLLGPPKEPLEKPFVTVPLPHILFQLKPWMNSERLQFRTGTVP